MSDLIKTSSELTECLKRINKELKLYRKLRMQLICARYFSWNSKNLKLIGPDGVEDKLYQLGWHDGYNARYNDEQKDPVIHQPIKLVVSS